MSKTKFEKKPFFTVHYYSGTYTCDMSEDENVASIKDLDFTIILNYDDNSDSYEISEITWINNEPKNKELVEEKIRESFNEELLNY